MCSTDQPIAYRLRGPLSVLASVPLNMLCALGLAVSLLAGCSGPRTVSADAASARAWDEYRVQAARRIVAANRPGTYDGVVVEPLLAIPVLEIELNGDGSIRGIDVLRQPSQARETTQLAIAAVRRAAPFASVAHLPKPWKFAEAFLFNEDKRFKPRSLDVR